MYRQPRFDLPPLPTDANSRNDVIRIVDPAGHAIAWLSVTDAVCLAFATRVHESTDAAWRKLLLPGGISPIINGISEQTWSLSERDPTAVKLQNESMTGSFTLQANIEDGSLHLRLVSTTHDARIGWTINAATSHDQSEPLRFVIRAGDEIVTCSNQGVDDLSAQTTIERMSREIELDVSPG